MVFFVSKIDHNASNCLSNLGKANGLVKSPRYFSHVLYNFIKFICCILIFLNSLNALQWVSKITSTSHTPKCRLQLPQYTAKLYPVYWSLPSCQSFCLKCKSFKNPLRVKIIKSMFYHCSLVKHQNMWWAGFLCCLVYSYYVHQAKLSSIIPKQCPQSHDPCSYQSIHRFSCNYRWL